MGKLRRSFALASAALALGLCAAPAGAQRTDPAGPPAAPALPLLFAENRGQWAAEVSYQARGNGLVASVLADGFHVDLGEVGLRLRFCGAHAAGAEGLDARPGRVHFPGLTGPAGAATFGRVRLAELVPGVDLELYEHAGRIEYDLVLAPGADAGALALALEGAEAVAVDEQGGLRATVEGCTLLQRAPVAWQTGPGGERRPLACAWRERGDGSFGFDLGARDERAGLVIDPVLVYGTHVGGSNADAACGAVVDEEGAVYVTGWARSADFPLTARPFDAASKGKEGVVFKLRPDGRELVYATYFGGRGDDEGVAIQVDREGRALVAGHTESDDFPTTRNAFDRDPSGGADAFLLQLSGDGSTIAFATLLGGSAEDSAAALALSSSGQVTVAGTTRSRDFPVTTGSHTEEPRGGRDAFVARFDPFGQALVFSTRLGGSQDDEARGLAVDAEGSCLVTGRTQSHDFPTTLGAFDRERCATDAFVTRLSGGGRTLLYSTFLGGSGQDEATAVAVDRQGRAVVVGWTQSMDFPFDEGTHAPGRKDGFAVRLTETGNALDFARPIGGGSADEALGVAIDPLGAAWVVGRTRSADFPATHDAHRSRLLGPADAFLVQLSAADGAALYATLLGGEGEDQLCCVRGDVSGTTLVLAGWSAGIPLDSRGPLAGKRRGPSDAFVLRFDPHPPAPPTHTGPFQAGLAFE